MQVHVPFPNVQVACFVAVALVFCVADVYSKRFCRSSGFARASRIGLGGIVDQRGQEVRRDIIALRRLSLQDGCTRCC